MAINDNMLDDLMYKSQVPTFSTNVTPQILDLLSRGRLNNRQLETISAVQTANQAFEGSGLSNASDFMTNLAMQESNLGGDKEWGGSYSPFQIDPIGYEDIVSKGAAGEQATLNRASIANQLLEGMGYGENFDILNLPLDEIRDPMISALLTRMKLATIKEKIPTDLNKQSVYWKKYWNSEIGLGETKDFVKQIRYYNNILGIKTYDNTVLEDNSYGN